MTYRSDKRGQSVTLGTILVFAILVGVLGLHQAIVVPNLNSEVEFNHQETVDEDFSDLHAGLMNAAERNEAHTASIKVGLRYPNRGLALNPPDVAGTIRTTTLDDIDGTVEDEAPDPNENFDIEEDFCGWSSDVDAKAFLYQPDYNHLDGVGVQAYENTVTYQDVDDSVAHFDQELVDDGRIRLRPLTNGSISRSTTSSESVTFKAGATGGTTVDPVNDWTLELPTRLSMPQWKTILNDEMGAGNRIKSISDGGSGIVDITFKDKVNGKEVTYEIKCTPIGVETKPNNDPTIVPSDDDEESGVINPVGGDELELESATRVPPDGYDATFHNNAGSTKEVTEVRIPYVSQPGTCTSPCEVTLDAEADGSGVTVEVAGGFEDVNDPSDWTWNPDGNPGHEKVVRMTGDPLSSTNSELAVVFKFSDGTTSTYFISEAS